MSAPFSPIMMVGAFVLAPTNRGMIEASITRRRCRPWTRNCGPATGFPSTSLDLNDHYRMTDCGDVAVVPGAAVMAGAGAPTGRRSSPVNSL